MACRASEWNGVRNAEAALFYLMGCIEDKRRVIALQAWFEGDHDRIYEEAKLMEADILEMRKILSDLWSELLEDARS